MSDEDHSEPIESSRLGLWNRLPPFRRLSVDFVELIEKNRYHSDAVSTGKAVTDEVYCLSGIHQKSRGKYRE
ncbi:MULTISPECIES: hypothetical protein [Halorubrum]|uniref:hypothetical protein n=1 Tax=Halorubrum TaxID=56688 RepID=UPI00142EC4D2|nr:MULTISPECIES: hypothetical protein [Halorubrum]